jgi:hypothetical protein
MEAALTLRQAEAISNDFQDLLGQFIDPYANRYKYIQYVVPAPYDERSRQFFMYLWTQVGCPAKALQFYKGDMYDVIVVAGDPCLEDYPDFIDLRTFLKEHEGNFDLSAYAAMTKHAMSA